MHILTKKILLDMLSLYTQEKVHVKKGDTAIRLSFHLSEHGKPYEIKNGKAVFVGQKPNGKLVEEKCNVRGNVVEFDLTKDTTDITGVVDCELELYTDDGLSLTSPRFAMVVDGTLRSSNTGNDIPDNPDTPADPDDPAEDPVIGVEASVDEDGVLTMRSLIDNTHAIEASIWADESYIDKEAPIGEAYVDYPAQNEVKKSLASMFYTDSPADGTKLYIKVKAYADRAESDAVPEVVIETIWQSAWASPDSTECTHNWSEATCTAPKTCVLCGATEGEALGHEWAAATCDKPKTCTRCGKTEGNTLGHDYVDGVCTRCGAADDPYDPDAGVKLSIDEYGILTMQYKREHHARWYSVYCFTAANYSSGGTPVFYLECVSPSGGLEYDGATLNLAETFAAYTDLPADGEVYYLRVTADDEYTNPAAEFRFVWDSKWNEGLSEKITASVDASGVLTMHSTLEGVRWYDVHIRYESGDDSAPKASAHHVGEGVLDRDGDNRAEIYLTSIFDDYGESYPEDAQPIYVRVYADDENMYPVREFQFVWDSNWNDSGSAASVAASVDAFGTLEMSTSLDYIRWYDVWIWDKAAGGDFIASSIASNPIPNITGLLQASALRASLTKTVTIIPQTARHC